MIVNTVQNGEEALSYPQGQGKCKVARGPDVVLLDINMPKKNGYGMLGRVKKEPRLLRGVSRIPLVRK